VSVHGVQNGGIHSKFFRFEGASLPVHALSIIYELLFVNCLLYLIVIIDMF